MDVTDFAQDEENSNIISKEDFIEKVNISQDITRACENHDLEYMLSEKNVLMMYDTDNDIHYIFGIYYHQRQADVDPLSRP
jgi:hypothetical protein